MTDTLPTDVDLDQLLDRLIARSAERAGPVVNVAGEDIALAAAVGRVQVSPGDTVATAWGNPVWDQSTNVFATAADRDSQWSSPHDGAVCYTTDTQTLWLYRLPAWRPIGGAGLTPLTGTAPLQTSLDASGELWVAKGGVAAGVWKKARDVLHCRVFKAGAYTFAVAATMLSYDQATKDDYVLWTGGQGFKAPAAGWYQVQGKAAFTSTAVGQQANLMLYKNGALATYAAGTISPAAAGTHLSLAGQVVYLNANDLLAVYTASFGGGPYNGIAGDSQTYATFDYLGAG